jgi:hypothetical protein
LANKSQAQLVAVTQNNKQKNADDIVGKAGVL